MQQDHFIGGTLFKGHDDEPNTILDHLLFKKIFIYLTYLDTQLRPDVTFGQLAFSMVF